MPFPDLPHLRDTFIAQDIMLCFNGVFTAALIDEIGKALRNHMQGQDESPTAITDVFSVYIEMTQNIRHYMQSQQLGGAQAIATIVVSHRQDGQYTISAGNMVRHADAGYLRQRVEQLNAMSGSELKTEFKTQLRKPRESLQQNNGAGLGLIDMARKASEPLWIDIQPVDDAFSFFSLRVIIGQ